MMPDPVQSSIHYNSAGQIVKTSYILNRICRTSIRQILFKKRIDLSSGKLIEPVLSPSYPLALFPVLPQYHPALASTFPGHFFLRGKRPESRQRTRIHSPLFLFCHSLLFLPGINISPIRKETFTIHTKLGWQFPLSISGF